MKKILSLVMVVAMLVAVLAFVGCNDTNQPADTTTAGTTTAGTTTAGTTTAGTTTAGTTTAGTTTSNTAASDTTTASETTTLPNVFARLDFGTASKAQDLGMTSHEYLVGALATDANFISVEYTEDSIIVKAVQDHPEIKFKANKDDDGSTYYTEDIGKDAAGNALYSVSSYALCFDDLTTYEFDDELPVTKKYMRIRIKNQTTNNVMSFRFRRNSDSNYFTTTMGYCLYLQGGAPTVDDYVAGNHKLTCEASDVYQTFTYDMQFFAALGRASYAGLTQGNSYVHYAYYVGSNGGSYGSHNWSGADDGVPKPIIALQLSVLGAYGGRPYWASWNYSETRENIKAGATVEIDYIIFGASKADLNTYVSYIESASISESKAISESESIAAAATATTAAA